ncbi:mitochondrial substrate carrier family protein E-like isoform X3 [Hordeum vulgare subsp. vulgare]|uniref:mitochondrial substrate carrier family protein E-like isoform X3 n=1 Tax=Hordeum vulgare subsp. vulgare TaxID=112509 RepID=UPI001D1A4CEB|nr:mitochondrial substrate carrier family protein E-like isoform X3 [Hordeum vulgare subsp. vulgare]
MRMEGICVGSNAGAFGEGMMHPVDTMKTRLQSQAIMSGAKAQKNIFQMVRTVWASDGLRGFYRGVSPGITGSLATGDTLGSFIYVPFEVMKQQMQVQGSSKSWALNATKGNFSQSPGTQMYGYYNGMFHAGSSIWRDHGVKGLYAGYCH